MKKKLSLFAATMLMALAALAYAPAGTKADGPDSCRTQCRVAYEKCVRSASNPGGLNQCGKAYQACLAGCQ